MRINYIHTNLVTFSVYLLAYFIEKKYGLGFVLNIAGISILFFATPFAFFQIFKLPSFSLIEKYFSFLIFYFFLFTPVFYFLNQFLRIHISLEIILITNLIIFASALIATRFKNGDEIIINPKNIFDKKNRLLLVALAGYLLLHSINYHFYRFMPEWDGYTDLIKIGKGIAEGNIAQSYRGFFYASTEIISIFSKIDPYSIFTIIFIGLQTSLILVISRLIHIFEIRKKSLKSLLYLAAISIPVINMEIDMIRPQNVVIIFLPILIYFLFQFFTEKKLTFLVLASITMLFGIHYHEFFIFPLLAYASWLLLFLFKKALAKNNESKDRIIYSLLLACLFLIGIIAAQQISTLHSVITTAQNILRDILNISAWRLWFLGNYASDGANLQMGWPGFDGALKYYAYYFSPLLSCVALLLIFFLSKKGSTLRQDNLIRVISPLLLILFIFAEILPRMNHIYLPERFWLLIDILLLLIAIPLFKQFSEQYSKPSRFFMLTITILSIIGIGGSFYIAIHKKALTSQDEYRAALWIKNNTPENAFFITQAANGPMINFFAKRTTIPTEPEYFLSKKVLEQNPDHEIKKLDERLEKYTKQANTLAEQYTSNEVSFSEFADKIQAKKLLIKKTGKERDEWRKLIDQPKYIVYSLNKFDTLYKDREWWMLANAYGANLEKFNKTYPLVYDQNGVYIWKVR